MVKYDRSRVKLEVIHHLGDKHPACKTPLELIRRSQPNGYELPAYDFGILDDGTIVNLRPLSVQGAHCISTIPKYVHTGNPQWWNQNSVGVVLGIDAQLFKPSKNMLDGLVRHLVSFGNSHGFGVGGMYPHGQVKETLCPCCTYKRAGMVGRTWSYDDVEKRVNKLCKVKSVL